MVALKIPEDLAAQANQIPGLSDRLARFIKLEIVQHEQRLKRFHPETLDLVARARQNAETQRASGYNLDEIKRSFDRHLQDLTEDNL